jgi:hypothetical protein
MLTDCDSLTQHRLLCRVSLMLTDCDSTHSLSEYRLLLLIDKLTMSGHEELSHAYRLAYVQCTVAIIG